jgi:hypothetical protein
MDNETFRNTYREVNDRCCVYEKSVLTNQCTCSQAERFCIAEREGVRCSSATGQQQCVDLLQLLRAGARFALKSSAIPDALPHGKAMRIQVGGLRGLHRVLRPELPLQQPIVDVCGLISDAKRHFGSLENLPLQTIIKEIAVYQGRPRRSPRRR